MRDLYLHPSRQWVRWPGYGWAWGPASLQEWEEEFTPWQAMWGGYYGA